MGKKRNKKSEGPTMNKSLTLTSSRNNGLTIYICTHVPFTPSPLVESRPDIYKIITNCDDPFPATKLEILRVNKMICDYGAEENMLLNEYRMINAIYNLPHKSKYIGICHYRRYYNFGEIERIASNADFIFGELGYEILLGKPIYFRDVLHREFNNEEYFAYWHSYSGWNDAEKVFKDFYPELSNEFDEMKNANFLHNSAMMIMPRDLFDDWCDYIYPLYDELKEKLNIHNFEEALQYVDKYSTEFIKSFNPYYTREMQARFIGYVLERYLAVWLREKHEDGKTLLDKSGEIQWYTYPDEAIKAQK